MLILFIILLHQILADRCVRKLLQLFVDCVLCVFCSEKEPLALEDNARTQRTYQRLVCGGSTHASASQHGRGCLAQCQGQQGPFCCRPPSAFTRIHCVLDAPVAAWITLRLPCYAVVTIVLLGTALSLGRAVTLMQFSLGAKSHLFLMMSKFALQLNYCNVDCVFYCTHECSL